MAKIIICTFNKLRIHLNHLGSGYIQNELLLLFRILCKKEKYKGTIQLSMQMFATKFLNMPKNNQTK